MNKRDELPAASSRAMRDDAQAVVFILQILSSVVLRMSTLNRQHSTRRSALAGQLGDAAHRVRALGLAPTPSAELANSIRDSIKVAKEALIELEPRVEKGPISVFFYRVRSAIARGLLVILRRPSADPLVAVRAALAQLDGMLVRVDAPPRQNHGERSTNLSGSELAAATDQSRLQGLEPDQPVQPRIAPHF
ncbi:MAG: hypothetical protein C5B60_05720 [Chloroflexi bacterium]|nr:MAG: hypothetical protein C5B60_05720 [Chloroflexota bacterium]